MSDEHKKAFGTPKLPFGGFPDTGNGRISDILDYKQWVTINSAQRIHMNYLEHLPMIVFFTLVGGLSYPIQASAVAFGYVAARFIYSEGYKISPKL